MINFSVTCQKNQSCLSCPLGMKTGAITDEQITAGSSYNASTSPEYARLDGHGAWCPNTTHLYLRINLVIPHVICAIATQGNSQLRLFTKKYRLILRIGEAINHYEDSNGRKVTFFFFFFLSHISFNSGPSCDTNQFSVEIALLWQCLNQEVFQVIWRRIQVVFFGSVCTTKEWRKGRVT